MVAKIIMVIAAYIALSPHVSTLKYRMIFVGLSVATMSGLLGTATRLEAARMIPVNFGLGLAAGLAVTIVLHFTEVGLRGRGG